MRRAGDRGTRRAARLALRAGGWGIETAAASPVNRGGAKTSVYSLLNPAMARRDFSLARMKLGSYYKMVRRFEAAPVDLFLAASFRQKTDVFCQRDRRSNPGPSASGPNFTKHSLRAEPRQPNYAINGRRWGDHCLDVSRARLPVIVTESATRPWEAAMWPVCQDADRIRPARGARQAEGWVVVEAVRN